MTGPSLRRESNTKLLPILLAATISGCGEPGPSPDLILHDATVYTADAEGTVAEALAIRDGRFTAVGSEGEVMSLAGPNTEVRDLDGRAVVPGLGDDHLHEVGDLQPGVDLSSARTMEQLLDAIARAAEEKEPGELIVTQSDWHEGQLQEQRLPYRDDLDRAVPNHPVVVRRGALELILNSAALEHFGIDSTTVPPEGGRIGRYENGRLNGELVDSAMQLVDLPDPGPETEEDRVRRLGREHRILNRFGITWVRYAGAGPARWRALRKLRDQGRLSLRVSFLVRPYNETDDAFEPTAAAYDSILTEWGFEPGLGDEWLRVAGIKLSADGGYEGGLMRKPYEEPWGNGGSYYGNQDVPTEMFTGLVKELSRQGWRVATHVVGDSAFDVVLHAYQAADSVRSIEDRRWAIEHAFMPRDEHFPVMRELGLVMSLQHHLYVAAPSLVKYWGRERAERTTPVGLFLENGVPVAAGTDAPTNPHNPFQVMYHFVTRETISAGAMGEEFGISRHEALRALTWGNAYLAFDEDERGTIEEGKLADLAVLSRDVMRVPAEQIKGTRSLLTLVGGRVVHEADEISQ